MEKRQEEKDRTDLLEQLSVKMGCQYLSDLRGTKHKIQCCAILKGISAEKYTIRTWNDAIYYITGETADYSLQEEAKKGLIKWLEKNIHG